MRRARILAVFGLLVLALVPGSPARSQVDLVQGFADAVGLSWVQVPQSAAVDDASDDLFTLEGEAATAPGHVDLLRTEQFGFTLTEEGFEALFGDGGSLSCDLPEVSCPTYPVEAELFAAGAFVIALHIAAAPPVEADSTFTAAVLAFDDDWPTFQDPRPNSPFVGTNKAWRVDLAAGGDSVRFLQVVTGPYEEFQTDARVLLGGDVIWFVIPPAEFPLQATISGIRGHTFEDPVADVDGSGDSPALTTPVGQTGGLTAEQAATTTAGPTTTTTAAETTSTVSSETTPTSVPDTTTPAATPTTSADVEAGGISPIVFVVVGLIVLLILLFFLFRPRQRCREEYEAWQAAKAACAAAKAAGERARAEADRLRAELDRLRKDYPPLGFDESDEPTIEMDDGETMSGLDVALMKWDDKTRQPPISEGTGAGPAGASAQAAAQRARLREEYRRIKDRETELLVQMSEAEKAAREAEAKADQACAEAETAHQAYLRCMGQMGAAPTAGSGGGEEAKPEESKPQPEEPEPKQPEPQPRPEEPQPQGPKPEEPKPEEPKPPAPPPPPVPGGGAADELSRQCEEGAQREGDVKVATFEMLRDRARARITIGNDLTDDIEEFETHAIEAINEAGQWAAARARIKGQEGVLYTIDISIQMERVTARCSTLEVCRNGRWERMSFPQREVSEPEFFEKATHRENLDHKTLRHVLQTARNEASRGGREALDRFCR